MRETGVVQKLYHVKGFRVQSIGQFKGWLNRDQSRAVCQGILYRTAINWKIYSLICSRARGLRRSGHTGIFNTREGW